MPWLDAAVRIRLFVGLLFVAGHARLPAPRPPPADPDRPFLIPWPIAALAFYLGEVNVVVIHFLRERHSFSLSELPGVIGLFLLTPTDYCLALHGRRRRRAPDRPTPAGDQARLQLRPVRGLAVVAPSVFHTIAGPHDPPGPQEWLAAFASSGATAVLGAVLVATVISLSGGAPQFKKLPEMIGFSGMVAMANTSLALLAVMVLWIDPRSAILLAVPTAIVFLAYRAYIAEREKHERLELLYESSRLLHYAPELDSAIAALLEHARRMFRAERAELVLFPDPLGDGALRSTAGNAAGTRRCSRSRSRSPTRCASASATSRPPSTRARRRPGPPPRHGQEAMIGPLVGERGVLGAITIINRLGEGSRFEADDLRLLETVANQAAVALENGQLEQSLHELSLLKEQLRHQAYHDALTGLANRPLFVEEVERRLAGATDAPPPRP